MEMRDKKLTVVIPGKLPSSKELLGFKLYFPFLCLPQNHSKLTSFFSLPFSLFSSFSQPQILSKSHLLLCLAQTHLLIPLLALNLFPNSLSPPFSHFISSSVFQLVFFFFQLSYPSKLSPLQPSCPSSSLTLQKQPHPPITAYISPKSS